MSEPRGTPDEARTSAAGEGYWREIERMYGTSPIHRALGLSIHVTGAGEVTVTYDGTDTVGNRLGTVAGGALAAMLDSAATQAVRTLLDPADGFATVDLYVSFIRPGKIGQPLSTIGRAERVGRSLGSAHATTTSVTGEVVAKGMATIAIHRASREKAST